jgi:hypothetical protein
MKVHPKIGELPRFGEHRMIGDPLEHLAELILQDRGHSFVFPPGLNRSFSGKAMKSCFGLTFALLCLVQAAGSAVARIAIDGNRSIGPAYTPDPSLVPRPEVPKGTVIEFKIDSTGSLYFPGQSRVTGAFSRRVWVYVPKQYVKGEKAPFMVSQDAIYRPWLINFLDNAIYDKKLPIMVIIFADNGGNDNGIGVANVQGTERNLEYDTVSARYGQWVQAELLPRVESETKSQITNQAVKLTLDPEGRGAIGCSSGAAAAFAMAWFQPDAFRRIISYSGSYTNWRQRSRARDIITISILRKMPVIVMSPCSDTF